MAKIDKKNKLGMIPWIFAAFFTTFILVDIAFFVAAKKSWRGVSTKNSYQKGRDYNDVLKKTKAQKDLGWKFTSKLTQSHKKIATLQVCLFDKNANKIRNAKLTVKLSRPVQEGNDFSQNLIESDDCFATKLAFPTKGQWNFEFVAIKNDDVFQDVKRYVIR